MSQEIGAKRSAETEKNMSYRDQIKFAVMEIKREVEVKTFDADETYDRAIRAYPEISVWAWNEANDILIKEGVLQV